MNAAMLVGAYLSSAVGASATEGLRSLAAGAPRGVLSYAHRMHTRIGVQTPQTRKFHGGFAVHNALASRTWLYGRMASGRRAYGHSARMFSTGRWFSTIRSGLYDVSIPLNQRQHKHTSTILKFHQQQRTLGIQHHFWGSQPGSYTWGGQCAGPLSVQSRGECSMALDTRTRAVSPSSERALPKLQPTTSCPTRVNDLTILKTHFQGSRNLHMTIGLLAKEESAKGEEVVLEGGDGELFVDSAEPTQNITEFKRILETGGSGNASYKKLDIKTKVLSHVNKKEPVVTDEQSKTVKTNIIPATSANGETVKVSSTSETQKENTRQDSPGTKSVSGSTNNNKNKNKDKQLTEEQGGSRNGDTVESKSEIPRPVQPKFIGDISVETHAHVGLQVAERFMAPRDPIILCHGLFGFDVVGPSSLPSLQVHYWRGIKEALESIGCKVHVSRVGTVDSLMVRAQQMVTNLNRLYPKGQRLNFVGHSMGGLDARYLISHLKEERHFDVNSLISVATPHRGSSFMDWCREALGVGYILDDKLPIKLSFIEERLKKIEADKLLVDSDKSKSDLTKGKGWNERNVKGENGQGPSSSSSSGLHSATNDSSMYMSDPSVQAAQMHDDSLINKLLNITGLSPHQQHQEMDSKKQAKLRSETPIMDATLGLGFSNYVSPLLKFICLPFDSPAFCNLTREYCREFNKYTPDDPDVTYMSYAAIKNMDSLSLLYFSHNIVSQVEGPNDGLVALDSAKWGEFMGVVECDHWQLVPPRLRSGPTTSEALSILARMQKERQQRMLSSIKDVNTLDLIQSEAKYLELKLKSIERGLEESAARAAARMCSSKDGTFDSIGFYLRLATALAERGF